MPTLQLRLPIAAALVCALFATRAPAQEKPAGIAWERDYDAAVKKAEAERKPLFVAFLMRGESANEAVVRQHFRNAEIIEASRKFVCVACCPDAHGSSACTAFPPLLCSEHVAAE